MKEFITNWIEQMVPWLSTHGIRILLIAIVAYFLNKLLIRVVTRLVRVAVVSDKYTSKEAEVKRENTLIRIFRAIISVTIIGIAILMILQEAGLNITPILTGAGIVGLAVGFGGQYLIRDIITGFFIILENQYRIGDVVALDDSGGVVEDIGLRMTTLRDIDGTVHHIPHGEIRKVLNRTKTFARVNINLGISYDSDLDHVINTVNRTGHELANDPDWKEKIISPPQFVRVDDFADSAIIIKILGDTKPLRQWEVSGELRKRLKIAFDREKIVIPFPQVVVHPSGK